MHCIFLSTHLSFKSKILGMFDFKANLTKGNAAKNLDPLRSQQPFFFFFALLAHNA